MAYYPLPNAFICLNCGNRLTHLYMEIGHKIKKVRELKNFTQEYMAERLRTTQSTYSRLEKDEGDISLFQLEQIAEVLGMRVEDLLSFDEKYVLNNYGETKGGQVASNITNYFPEILKQLYEDKIKLLEDKIKYLEGLQTQVRSSEGA